MTFSLLYLDKPSGCFAGATATGGTTNGRLFANADAAFGLFDGPFVAPATSAEDEAFAKGLLGGRGTTKDAFAG